jgi:hypothetical protein
MSRPISLVCRGCGLGDSACQCAPFSQWVLPPVCRCGRPLVKERSRRILALLGMQAAAGAVGLDVAALVGAPRVELPPDACGSLHRCDWCEFESDDLGALVMHLLDAHGSDGLRPSRAAVSVAPPWLAPPTICGACDVSGASAVTGPLRWHVVPLVHEHLQTMVLVPLHASCTHEAGVDEALQRLGVALTMKLLTVGVPHGA